MADSAASEEVERPADQPARASDRATPRLLVACGLFSLWFVALLGGVAGGGTIHLVLAAALVVFPWSALRGR
jgi:uncharacterized RDD family membrane protein YckC